MELCLVTFCDFKMLRMGLSGSAELFVSFFSFVLALCSRLNTLVSLPKHTLKWLILLYCILLALIIIMPLPSGH